MEKQLTEATEYIGLEFFTGGFHLVASNIIKKYNELTEHGWIELEFDICDDSESEWIIIKGKRLETDDELNERIANERWMANLEKKKLEQEKAEYYRLKAKFEK